MFFSQVYFLYLFLIFAHLQWFRSFGDGVLDCFFCGLGFQLMGFGACGVGPSGFSGVGDLYINIEE